MGSAAGQGVQVFGRRDSRETQKALRFFRERRISLQFVDLALRPLAPTELRRFSERLGAPALLETSGRRYRELGLAYVRFEGTDLFDRLLADSALLRLPLVRHGNSVAAGDEPAAWRAMAAAAAGPPSHP